MTAEDFVSRLEQARPRSSGKWLAKCPAHHPDKTPSLSICESGTRILIRCFSGCTSLEIVSAMGLEMRDLFTDAPLARGQRRVPKLRLDLAETAFRLEMAALDRRIKADQILQIVATVDGEDLNDDERNTALNAVADALANRERAALFEAVADDLRGKQFFERNEDVVK